MLFEIGNYGIQIVIGFAVGFGAIAQVIAGRNANRWLWVAGTLGWIVGALVVSEVLFGTMTEEQIQPIIDGLAYDEALLGGLIGGLVAFVVAWMVTREVAGVPTTHRAPV